METIEEDNNNNNNNDNDNDPNCKDIINNDGEYSKNDIYNGLGLCELLGEGTYITSYKYRVLNKSLFPSTSYYVTLNKIKVKSSTATQGDNYVKDLVQRLYEYQIHCNHPNISRVFKIYTKGKLKIRVFREYGERSLESLYDYRFTPLQIKSIMFQLVQAVNHLHQFDIVHGSIISRRILFTSGVVGNINKNIDLLPIKVKLVYSPSPSKYTGYVAPEKLVEYINVDYDDDIKYQQNNHIKPTISSDIWALGRIFYNLLNGPYYPSHIQYSDMVGYLYSLFQLLGTPTKESWPSINSSYFPIFKGTSLIDLLPPSTDLLAINLLKNMLVLNPDHRIDTFAALEHPYFKDILPQP
ncbi:hypothetical protein DFA_10177 [Cavenderia fasciculata]|uniref:Protein kinase domain-containing protein n=1 Tax=Cavenderia fasciculata TaxID=261658 RepID=F4Q9H4_CACFS|nr:uncharacterized protein DFA_10177 [Cavenderia fasciculata]EGG15343.1 hypothetical protein DFA_10177 [Cavenderia fasciculata]|eukprot:XP_004354085.1 hypothetical protein DFA_10177 [Cavenderia fasciculata]